MRIGDYYRGVRIELATKLPPEEVERQINDGAASILTPFATGVVGSARFGAIRLRLRRSLFRNDAKPILAGRIRPDRGGSLLHLVWRGPLPMLVFFPLMYLNFAAFAAVFVAAGPGGGMDVTGRWAVLFAFLLMLPVPALILILGLRSADADLEEFVLRSARLNAREVAPRPI